MIFNIINGGRTGGLLSIVLHFSTEIDSSRTHEGSPPVSTIAPPPHIPRKCSRRGNQTGERWRQLSLEDIMMTAHDIRPRHIRDVPRPSEHPRQSREVPVRLASLLVFRALQPHGNAREGCVQGWRWRTSVRRSRQSRGGSGCWAKPGLVMSQRNLRAWKADRMPLPAPHCK